MSKANDNARSIMEPKDATAPAREVPAATFKWRWSNSGYRISRNGVDMACDEVVAALASLQPVQRQVSDEREAFERVHLGGVKKLARRNEHGEYVAPSINDAWAGWQSARSLAQPADGDGVALPDGGQQ